MGKSKARKSKYSEEEKMFMAMKHLAEHEPLRKVAKIMGCSHSTVFYASFPDKYEEHKEYVILMAKRDKK